LIILLFIVISNKSNFANIYICFELICLIAINNKFNNAKIKIGIANT